MGVVVKVGSQNPRPVAKSATRTGHPLELRWAKGWASPPRTRTLNCRQNTAGNSFWTYNRSMCITVPVAISIVSACFAGASACVAFAAWRTSREKLRLDLYNRRFDIYSRALDLLHVLETWNPSESEKNSASLQQSPELEKVQRAFTKASREGQFLFDDSSGVHKVLEQMHGDVIAMIGFKRDLRPKFNGPELIPELQKDNERRQRFLSSFPALEKGMKKYLDFHALSG